MFHGIGTSNISSLYPNVQTFKQSNNVSFLTQMSSSGLQGPERKKCSGCVSFTMPNLLSIKLAGVNRSGFFFLFIPLNNPVEKRTKATIGWNFQDCSLVFYFILMSWWILCSLKVMNWLARRLKASDSQPPDGQAKARAMQPPFHKSPPARGD